jgi:hypothetical protein
MACPQKPGYDCKCSCRKKVKKVASKVARVRKPTAVQQMAESRPIIVNVERGEPMPPSVMKSEPVKKETRVMEPQTETLPEVVKPEPVRITKPAGRKPDPTEVRLSKLEEKRLSGKRLSKKEKDFIREHS